MELNAAASVQGTPSACQSVDGHNGLSSLMYHALRQHDTQDPTSRLAMQWKLSSVLINRRLVLSRTLIVFCVIKIITIDLCI